MNFVNTILKKTPFKSEASEEKDEENEVKSDAEKKEENTGSGGVGFVSNILKSTFKGNETSEPKSETETSEKPDDSNATASGGGFMSSVWKTTSLFRSDTTDGNKDRKESLSGEVQSGEKKEETSATGFISNVFDRTTSMFKSDATEKRKQSQAEVEKDAMGFEEEELCATDASGEPLSQKAFDSAKGIGNFLYSVANKAGQTVSATAKHLKHTVEQNSFLNDFSKEQQEFIKEHGGNIDVGDAPWIGCEDEEEVKKQIISLSQDKRNFVRSPPSGVQFDFDMQQILPVAVALLKEDEALNKMRFEVVPKLVNEETFWRNYFYRVSLIKQSTSLTNMNKGCKGWASSSGSSAEGPDEPSPTGAEPEFISDSIQGNLTDEDLRKGMRQMGVEKNQRNSRDDKQWEDEITKELQEFEVVSSDVNTAFDAELEKDLANL